MEQHFQLPHNLDDFISEIQSKLPSWIVDYRLEYTSTQLLAKEFFKSGYDGKAVFIVRNQTSGKGRHDRSWFSSSDGKDIAMTLLIPATGEIHKTILMNLVAGISVAESLNRLTGCNFRVKWPNDVFHGDSKICGVLSELLTRGEKTSIAVGIGINVNSMPDDFDSDTFLNRVDTVRSITGRKLDLLQFLTDIILTIDKNNISVQNDSGAVIGKWMKYGWRINAKIRFRELGCDWQDGILAGITKDGYLVINDSENRFKTELIEGDIIPFDI